MATEKIVIINGEPHTVKADYISYAALVSRAFPKCKPGRIMTVTWCHLNEGGSLKPGDTVMLRSHLIVNVTDTSGA